MQAADVSGLSLADAFRPSVVADELGRRFGLLSVARLLLLVPAGFLLVALFHGAGRSAWWRASGAAIAVGIAVVTALNGHAASGRWQEAAMVADVVHVLAASAWLGGLAILVVAVLPREEHVGDVVPGFSRLAAVAVAVLVVTGSFQGYRQVGSINALDTTYGRLLLAKLLAVAGLVAVGALSRQVVRHRLVEEGGVDELRRSVAVEAVLAAAVLVVTSLLVDAVPARARSIEPVSLSRVVEGVVIDVEVVPALAGQNDVHLYAQDPSAGLTGELDATAVLSLPSAGFENVAVPLVPAGRSHWSAYGLDIAVAGDWVLQVRIVRPDSFVETEFAVRIR
jgi:copper transport protein